MHGWSLLQLPSPRVPLQYGWPGDFAVARAFLDAAPSGRHFITQWRQFSAVLKSLQHRFKAMQAANEEPEEHVDDVQVQVHGADDVLVGCEIDLKGLDVPGHPGTKYNGDEGRPKVRPPRLIRVYAVRYEAGYDREGDNQRGAGGAVEAIVRHDSRKCHDRKCVGSYHPGRGNEEARVQKHADDAQAVSPRQREEAEGDKIPGVIFPHSHENREKYERDEAEKNHPQGVVLHQKWADSRVLHEAYGSAKSQTLWSQRRAVWARVAQRRRTG